ncbi:hypothetical protein [Halocatena halophila]|uniref:hypothetical protein n=1 Tax=Halocatena halophila TaxID=2814576 RepID=UPI002ED48EC9
MPEREEARTLSRLSPGVSRRSFLGTTGAAAASLSVSGTAAAGSCSRQDSDSDVAIKKASTDEVELQSEAPESESVSDIDYDEVINVVEAGADNTGGESITPLIRDLASSNTLLKFPEGRYLVDEWVRLTGFKNFGMVGENATLVPAPASQYKGDPIMFKLGVFSNPGRNLEFRNFTVDYTAPNTGVRALHAAVSDGLRVENVAVEGVHDAGTWGPFKADIVDSDGYGIVKNVEVPEGGVYTKNTAQDIEPTVKNGPTGFLLSPFHAGRLDVVDSVIGAFPDNGLYDSESPGQVVVKGGRFANSNSGNIRITGDNSGVYGAHVVIDQNRPNDRGQHGVRFDGGKNLTVADTVIEMTQPNGHGIFTLSSVESATIENTKIFAGKNDARETIKSIAVRKGAGAIDIINSEVVQDHEGPALNISEGSSPVRVKGLSVSGESTGETGSREALITHRDSTEFRGLDVDLPNGSRRRALGIFSDSVSVLGGTYSSSGLPITVEGSDVLIKEVTAGAYDGSTVAVDVESGVAKLVNNKLTNGAAGDIIEQGNEYI